MSLKVERWAVMKTRKINKVLVGEALVGEGKEVAHVDLIMGPRGSAVETAFCRATPGSTMRAFIISKYRAPSAGDISAWTA